MTNQEKDRKSIFEKNLMSDLRNEYYEAGKKIPFDLEKIRKPHAEVGFGIMAIDEEDLQSEVYALVKKELIDKRDDGKYRISDLGIQREEIHL